MRLPVDKATTMLAMSAGSITYSWVADATEMTTFIASLVGIVTACMGAWFYWERAMDMRRKRKGNNGKKDGGERDSVSER